jgi:hypothetical protein
MVSRRNEEHVCFDKNVLRVSGYIKQKIRSRKRLHNERPDRVIHVLTAHELRTHAEKCTEVVDQRVQ